MVAAVEHVRDIADDSAPYALMREKGLPAEYIARQREHDDEQRRKQREWAHLTDQDAACLDATPHTTALVPVGYCLHGDEMVELEEVIVRDGMTRRIEYRCTPCGEWALPIAWKSRAYVDSEWIPGEFA